MNKCLFAGYVGNAPDIKYTPNGTQVASFSLAVKQWRRGADGEGKEETYWVPVTAFGKMAERVLKVVGKGAGLAISCRLEINRSDGTDGPRVFFNFILEEFTVLKFGERGEAQATAEEDFEFDGEIPF